MITGIPWEIEFFMKLSKGHVSSEKTSQPAGGFRDKTTPPLPHVPPTAPELGFPAKYLSAKFS
jgi:hypothetical protein